MKDHEAEHAAWCEGHEPHGWQECPDLGWDEHGMFIKTPVDHRL